MTLEILDRNDFCSGIRRDRLLPQPTPINLNKCNSKVINVDNFRLPFFYFKHHSQYYFQKVQPYAMKSEEKGPKESPHQFNCSCTDCQTKYGSLPVLVQVIEGQELQNKKTELNYLPNSSSEPTPSTSHDSSSRLPKKEMKCAHCQKTFTHKGDFNKHLRIHTGEQPYSCPTCNRRFAHTSNLNRHLKVHSGAKPFTCDACQKTFSRADKLKLHKQTRTCKNYATNVCNKNIS